MKYLLAAILSLSVICASSQLAYSGFWPGHNISQPGQNNPAIDSSRHSHKTNYVVGNQNNKGILKKFNPDDLHPLSGWPGLASLACGIFGIWFFPAIAAIVFGVIGMKKGRKSRGLAIAGLCRGILFLLVIAAVIVYMIYFF